MLNYIWFGLMAVALVVAAFNGTAEAVTKATVDSASTAVEISIGLVGVMTLWLGIMRIAEAAGLVTMLGRALRPVLRLDVPRGAASHPAAGAIVVAIAANMLGLNNAATPLGIKAMEELQELNGDKETATNPMVTFMAMTTSGVQLIPSTMIGILAAAGSQNPTAIIAPALVATFIGTLSPRSSPPSCCSRSIPRPPPRPRGRRPNDPRGARASLALGRAGAAGRRSRSPACIRKVKVYDVFIEGAKEGFEVAVKIIPFLVGILVAIGMFRASGAMDLLTAGLRPVATATGFPAELIPLGDPAHR